MNEHKEIILEALIDYRGWYADKNGIVEDIKDKPIVNKVNNAIKFVENL